MQNRSFSQTRGDSGGWLSEVSLAHSEEQTIACLNMTTWQQSSTWLLLPRQLLLLHAGWCACLFGRCNLWCVQPWHACWQLNVTVHQEVLNGARGGDA
jgi:hypothetical protein